MGAYPKVQKKFDSVKSITLAFNTTGLRFTLISFAALVVAPVFLFIFYYVAILPDRCVRQAKVVLKISSGARSNKLDLSLAAPVAEPTHGTILCKDGGKEQAEYLTLAAARKKEILPGYTLAVLSDRRRENMGIRIEGEHPEEMLLEPGDVLHIPRVSRVVMVDGEVKFPSNFAHDSSHNVNDYIKMAGGYNDFGSNSRILIMRPSSLFAYAPTMWPFGSSVYPGGRLVVLPEVRTKHMQIAKDVSQIIDQMAVSTGVVVRLL